LNLQFKILLLDNYQLSGVPSGITNAAQRTAPVRSSFNQPFMIRGSTCFSRGTADQTRLSGICNAALNIFEFAIQNIIVG